MKSDPTLTEVAAYAATKAIEYACYAVMAISIAFFWIGTP